MISVLPFSAVQIDPRWCSPLIIRMIIKTFRFVSNILLSKADRFGPKILGTKQNNFI